MKKQRLVSLLLCVAVAATTVLSGCGSNAGTGTTETPNATKEAAAENAEATTQAAEQAASGENTLSVCIASEPDTIDPALNSSVDGATLCIHAFEGLMTLDENGAPKEAAAESYTVSDDQLTYTFTLRDGLTWSDGTPVTANDFVYSWNRAIAPETAADYGYMFEAIEGYADGTLNVTAVDDKTIEVKLSAVTPYFLELCAFPAYFPVHQATVEANGEAWATDPSTYVSNGAYTLTEWVHDSYMLYTKNPNYWNAANVGPETIKFVLMADDSAMLSAYEAGELDMIDSVPNEEIAALKTQEDYHVEGQLGTYYVSYNTTNEYLSDPLVRKALTLAVDRTYIVEQIGQADQIEAGAYVALGLTDADTTKQFREVGGDYYDPKDYEGNVELAKAALEEAGYPNGEGLPTFEYLYNEGTGHQAIGEALQNMWAQIGVNVELVSQEWSTFLNSRKSGDYDIARNGWLGDFNDPISFLDMWVTGGGNNDAQWSNTEFDALIERIKTSSDQAERMSDMHKAEDIIFDEWMLCPLYYYTDIYMINPQVQGFYSSPLGYKYFMYTTK